MLAIDPVADLQLLYPQVKVSTYHSVFLSQKIVKLEA